MTWSFALEYAACIGISPFLQVVCLKIPVSWWAVVLVCMVQLRGEEQSVEFSLTRMSGAWRVGSNLLSLATSTDPAAMATSGCHCKHSRHDALPCATCIIMQCAQCPCTRCQGVASGFPSRQSARWLGGDPASEHHRVGLDSQIPTLPSSLSCCPSHLNRCGCCCCALSSS